MKNKVLRWILRVLGVAAVGTTVTACYGTPYDEYEIKGKVLDADNNPIEGIFVTTQSGVLKDGVDLSKHYRGSATTKSDGTFLINDIFYISEDQKLFAVDIDGEENGGKFETTEVPLDLDEMVIVMEKEND